MAIMARWRMPPENWCGYSLATLSGLAMPTSRSTCTVFSLGLALGEVLVDADRLADLVADGKDGIQARHRVLEDHGYVVAPDLLHPLV